MEFNTSYDSACFIILAVLGLIYERYFDYPSEVKRTYLAFIIADLCVCVTDIIFGYMILYYVHSPLWLSRTVSTVNCAMSCIAGFFFFTYVHRSLERKGNVIFWLCRIFVCIYTVLLFINIPTGFFFSFSPEGDYVQGPFYPALTIVPYIMTFAGYVLLMREGRKLDRKYKIMHWVLISLGVSTAVLQVLFSGLMLWTFNLTITAMGMLFCFETPDYRNFIAMLRELDRSREAEKEARLKAQKANEEKSHFLARMSHEIRTPMNVIVGMDEMIMRECNDMSIMDYGLKMKNAETTLLSTINEILDFSKIESGRLEVAEKEYSLAELILVLLDLEQERAGEKGLEFCLKVDSTLPSVLIGDDLRIRQVITNLLSNAVKYTEKGSVTLRMAGETRGQLLHMTVAVEDTGIGIREEDLGRLCTEFERLDEARNRKIEGTGLGLSITSSLLKLMGSRLQVSSVYGQGSVFSFEIDQRIVSPVPVGDIRQQSAFRKNMYFYAASFYAPEAKLLVVDDKDLNLFVVKQLLKDTGIKVTTALSGSECIEYTSREHFDVILMDHMMPEPDGIETLHILRDKDLCPDTPVVAMTANAITGVEKMYLSEGFAAYISKPLEQQRLESVIKDLLPDYLLQEVPQKFRTVNALAGEEQEFYDSVCAENAFTMSETLKHFADKGEYLEVLEQYAMTFRKNRRELENKYDLLTQAAANADAEGRSAVIRDYRIAVHSMKSSSALVGLMELSTAARESEQAASAEDTDMIVQLQTKLTDELDKAEKALSKLYKWDKEADDGREVDAEVLTAILFMLRQALEDFDTDAMDSHMAELMEQPVPEPARQLREELQVAVTDLDADAGIELVDRISAIVKGGAADDSSEAD